MQDIKNFADAENYLISKIPKSYKSKYKGNWGLDRLKNFLKSLGNPQEKIKIIHVAGTSGKGSTSYLISHLLLSLGRKTGLYISPHIINLRERFQINNNLISEKKFIFYLNQIIPNIKRAEESDFGELSFFEITTALAFYIFYHEKLDYAVIETGLGGLYDATNTINNPNKISVITKIGLDHTDILGDTITKIAEQKAGIIQPGNIVITLTQEESAKRIIEKKSNQQSANLLVIKPTKNYHILKEDIYQTVFRFNFLNKSLQKISLSLIGEFQVENASLALATVIFLSKRDSFKFAVNKVKKALKAAHFIGRFQILREKNKIIVIDGAHNPQKIQSLVVSLKKLFPNIKFEFLLNFVKEKDSFDMLRVITPLAEKIIITEFKVVQHGEHNSQNPLDLAKSLKKLKFTNFEIVSNPENALDYALNDNHKIIVITGSLYLISALYPKVSKIKNVI